MTPFNTCTLRGYLVFLDHNRAGGVDEVAAGFRVGIDHVDGSQNQLFLHVTWEEKKGRLVFLFQFKKKQEKRKESIKN